MRLRKKRKNAPAATSQNSANQQYQQNYAQQTAQNNYQQQNFQQTAQPQNNQQYQNMYQQQGNFQQAQNYSQPQYSQAQNNYQPQPQQPANTQSQSSADEERQLMAAFCHDKEYYIDAFRKFNANNGSGIKWNWAAFFFSALQFCYRKLWLWGILIYIIEGILSSLGLFTGGIGMGFALIFNIICGCSSTKLYYKRYKESLNEARAMYPNLQDRIAYMKNKGGISVGAVILLIVLIVIAIAVASLAVAADSSYNLY